MKLSSYPKVFSVGDRRVSDILDGLYIIQEKIDGSQFSFGKIAGELCIRSRSAEIFPDNCDNMFKSGVEYVISIKDKLPEGLIFRGEYLRVPKHNSLKYNRIPLNHVIIFDIDDQYGNPLDAGEITKHAQAIGLEVVSFFDTKINNMEEVKEILQRESVLGGVQIEGFVIKNYAKFTEDKKYMCAKYVSEAYKENQKKDWKKMNPTRTDVVVGIVENLKTDARWNKAIQHLRERGQLTETLADIGPLLKEINQDIGDEETEWIKEQLFNHFIKRIRRGVLAGFPEWYKDQLMTGLWNAGGGADYDSH